MTWDFASFNLDDFCRSGRKSLAGRPQLWPQSIPNSEAYYKLDNTQIPGHKMFIDGMVRRVGLSLLRCSMVCPRERAQAPGQIV